jgi:hypothetical protein
LYAIWSSLTEVDQIWNLNDQLSLRCTFLIPQKIKSFWYVFDLYLNRSTLTKVYLICTLYNKLSPETYLTWTFKWSTLTEVYLRNAFGGSDIHYVYHITIHLDSLTSICIVYVICIYLRMLPALLRFTADDYPFGIFKLFLCLIWSTHSEV